MVAAIGFILGAGSTVAVFGVTLATSAGLTVAGALVNIAGSMLLNSVVQRLNRPTTPNFDAGGLATGLTTTQAPATVRPENIRINTKNSAAARLGHYGLVRAGGNTVFHRARDGISYRVVVHGHGEISTIQQRFLNNEAVTLDGSGYVTDAQYQHERSRVRILERSGVAPAAYYPEITAIWPEWTSSHRLDGLWTSLAICETVPPEQYRAMFPRNEPDISILAETKKVYDPRTGLTEFSENIALAIADYVASPDGFNRPTALDASDIAAQAAVCDRVVALQGGGTEKLYRVGGSYSLNERPQDVLGRMLSACAGRLRLKPNGKIGLQVGVWENPNYTITFGQILEVRDVSPGPDLLDRYNSLPARYTDQALNFSEVDAELWIDAARVAEDGEILIGQDKDLIMCPSHRQARQVMKILTDRENPRLFVDVLCKPGAFPAIYEDKVTLDAPEMGLAGDFEIASHEMVFDHGNLTGVALSLRSIDAGAFAQALDEQGAVQNAPEPDSPTGVPVPQYVTAAAAPSAGVAGIGLGWQPPPSDSLVPLVKVSPAGQGAFSDVSVGASVSQIVIPNLTDGATYDVSIAFVTPGGVVGQAVVLSGITSANDAANPAAPQALSVADLADGTGQVSLTTANVADLWKTEVLRSGVVVAVIYGQPNSTLQLVDQSGVGSFGWTARSVDVAARQSPQTTQVNQTIT